MSVLKIKNKKTGKWENIASLKGEAGPAGPAGENGKDYVLTEEDKVEIAELVLDLLPEAEGVEV